MDKWLEMVKSTTPADYLYKHFRKELCIPFDDPVVGAFELRPPLNLLLDTFEFNRLHHIHQAGLLYLTKPSATHTRLAHTIGVTVLAERCFNSMLQRGDFKRLDLDAEKIYKNRIYLIAGIMLHDIGHPPFSHALEPILKEEPGRLDHEKITASLILGEGSPNDLFKKRFKELSENVGELGFRTVSKQIDKINSLGLLKFELNKEILSSLVKTKEKESIVKEKELFDGEDVLYCLKDLIHSNIDIDRLDHYARDIYFLGFRPITFNPLRIVDNFSIVKENGEPTLCIREEAAPYVIGLLLVKEMLYKFVWSEPNNIGYTVMLRRALEKALKADTAFKEFYSWTDEELITRLIDMNNTISETLTKQLRLRYQMYEFCDRWPSRRFRDYESFSKRDSLIEVERKIVERLKEEIPGVIDDAVILFPQEGLKLEEININVLQSSSKIEMLANLEKYKDTVNFYETKKAYYSDEIRAYCFQPLREQVRGVAKEIMSQYTISS